MLYIKDFTGNKCLVCDTDDGTCSKLTKQQVIVVNEKFKVLGVSKDKSIYKVDIFKTIKKWKILGILNTKLDKFTINNLVYSVVDNQIELEGCLNRDLEMGETFKIPDIVDVIGDYCFCNSKRVKTIIMPDTIIRLGSECFSGCGSLESVKLSNNLKVIGDFCFSFCHSLRQITVPSSVANLKSFCFCGCTALKRIDILSDNTFMDFSCFRQCDNLEELLMYKNTYIENKANLEPYKSIIIFKD